MKTLSSMYARPMWEMMVLTHSSTFSHTLSFHSNSLKFTQKLYKIQMNSNKLGQMRIKLEQAVSKASWLWPYCCRKGAEWPDVQFANWLWPYCCRKGAEQPNLQQCKLTVKEGSTATWRTILLTVTQTVVRREQSDLIDNTICCCTDRCRKGA